MSDQIDRFEAHDVWVAFSLLTRIPVPVDHERAGTRTAPAAWAFPLVGLILGASAGVLGCALQWLGVPPSMTAAFILLAYVLATGAMHEDGLADCADGFWGGNTVERRLEIMKDSRLGTYGAAALMIFLLARYSGVASLRGWDLVLTLAAVGAASRAMMVSVMYMLEPVRKNGMSASAGQPSVQAVGLALGIGFAACVLLTGFSGIVLFGIMLLAVIPVATTAQRLLGGQTGDILGASQQCAEVAGLAAAIALL